MKSCHRKKERSYRSQRPPELTSERDLGASEDIGIGNVHYTGMKVNQKSAAGREWWRHKVSMLRRAIKEKQAAGEGKGAKTAIERDCTHKLEELMRRIAFDFTWFRSPVGCDAYSICRRKRTLINRGI